jgi:hypothetical protein
MKRVGLAVAGAALLVVAISIAQAHTGESTPDARPSSTPKPTQEVDVSRPHEPDLARQQVKEQAEQLRKAQDEIKKQVTEAAQRARQDQAP